MNWRLSNPSPTFRQRRAITARRCVATLDNELWASNRSIRRQPHDIPPVAVGRLWRLAKHPKRIYTDFRVMSRKVSVMYLLIKIGIVLALIGWGLGRAIAQPIEWRVIGVRDFDQAIKDSLDLTFPIYPYLSADQSWMVWDDERPDGYCRLQPPAIQPECRLIQPPRGETYLWLAAIDPMTGSLIFSTYNEEDRRTSFWVYNWDAGRFFALETGFDGDLFSNNTFFAGADGHLYIVQTGYDDTAQPQFAGHISRLMDTFPPTWEHAVAIRPQSGSFGVVDAAFSADGSRVAMLLSATTDHLLTGPITVMIVAVDSGESTLYRDATAFQNAYPAWYLSAYPPAPTDIVWATDDQTVMLASSDFSIYYEPVHFFTTALDTQTGSLHSIIDLSPYDSDVITNWDIPFPSMGELSFDGHYYFYLFNTGDNYRQELYAMSLPPGPHSITQLVSDDVRLDCGMNTIGITIAEGSQETEYITSFGVGCGE